MTSIEQWAHHHATVFGFADSFLPMVAAWVSEFATTGYGAGELLAATQAIAKLPAEKAIRYPGDHYAAIHRAVQTQRGVERERFAADRVRRQTHGEHDGRGVCEACGDSGWVIVPHADHVGQWCDAGIFVTGTVACSCFIGRRIVENWDPKRPAPLTIGLYEARVPNWRELADFKRRVDRARANTAGVARSAFAKTVNEIQRRAASGATA